MNCKKCGVDLRGIKDFDGYCEHCHNKYNLDKEKQMTDSFVTHLRQVADDAEIFSVNDLF